MTLHPLNDVASDAEFHTKSIITSIIASLKSEPRTSDSLNKGLPIKMTREKFQRK